MYCGAFRWCCLIKEWIVIVVVVVLQETWAPGTVVVALYPFSGTSTEDLPFAKMEKLTIVHSTNDPNWVKARNTEADEGMIPTSFVKQESKKEVKLNTRA